MEAPRMTTYPPLTEAVAHLKLQMERQYDTAGYFSNDKKYETRKDVFFLLGEPSIEKNSETRETSKNTTIIALAGLSCAGKNHVLSELNIHHDPYTDASQVLQSAGVWNGVDGDRYYFPRSFNNERGISVDDPRAWEKELLYEHIKRVKAGENISMVPRYVIRNDMGERSSVYDSYHASPINVFAGLHMFDPFYEELVDEYVCIEAPFEDLLKIRLLRDTGKQGTGQSPESILEQFIEEVMPKAKEFFLPRRKELKNQGKLRILWNPFKAEADWNRFVVSQSLNFQSKVQDTIDTLSAFTADSLLGDI